MSERHTTGSSVGATCFLKYRVAHKLLRSTHKSATYHTFSAYVTHAKCHVLYTLRSAWYKIRGNYTHIHPIATLSCRIYNWVHKPKFRIYLGYHRLQPFQKIKLNHWPFQYSLLSSLLFSFHRFMLFLSNEPVLAPLFSFASAAKIACFLHGAHTVKFVVVFVKKGEGVITTSVQNSVVEQGWFTATRRKPLTNAHQNISCLMKNECVWGRPWRIRQRF